MARATPVIPRVSTAQRICSVVFRRPLPEHPPQPLEGPDHPAWAWFTGTRIAGLDEHPNDAVRRQEKLPP